MLIDMLLLRPFLRKLAATALFSLCFNFAALAQTPATPPAPRSTDERLAALEAYVNNGDPGKSLTGVAGRGHNGWMMTSAALVLFMTLPGLALFYGGLVRKKNVLSVLAQCLGITGLVTILWWAFGYSLVFGTSSHPNRRSRRHRDLITDRHCEGATQPLGSRGPRCQPSAGPLCF